LVKEVLIVVQGVCCKKHFCLSVANLEAVWYSNGTESTSEMTRNQQLPTVQFYTRFLVGALVVLVAFSYQSVRAAYTEPTQNPPKYDTSQIPEIVNVGAAEQRVGNILIGAGTTGTCTGSGCYALCLNPDMTTYPGGTTDPMNCITSWDLTGLTAGLGVYLSRFNATQAAAVMGGAKVSDKISLVERFVGIADKIIIGGAMANTFLKYKGVDVGASKVETDQDATLDKIYAAARKKVGDATDDFILLPTDVAVAKSVDADQPREERAIDGIASNELALDIGSKTIDRYCSELEAAQSVIWNGTMGMAELQNFAHGSARVALTLATHPKITSIVGGGDTADFVLKWDAKEGGSFTHVSTGGGASLDLMAGKKLPGIESLMDA
jgi:hypothetical protein